MKSTPATKVEVRLDYTLHLPCGALEPGLLRLLAGIADGGSLADAARKTGLSYRHAWGLIVKWQECLGEPLAVPERGRGTRLAPLGEKLLWADARARERLCGPIAEATTELGQEFARVFATATTRLLVHASHDLALAGLRDFLRQQHQVSLEVQFSGSVPSLAALARNRVDLAGFHVAQANHGGALPAALMRHLRPATQRLIRFVSREQGLMVAPGNPRCIRGIEDLARPDVSFVNRQRGSGTRIHVDTLLRSHGISPRRVHGYDTEEVSHLSVAALVATGLADAGMGIRAAAAQYRLEFIPVLREHYYFACNAETLERPEMRALLAALADPALRETVMRLPGYDARAAGTVEEISGAFGVTLPEIPVIGLQEE
ncbi:MAG: helix-turn-helix transcriptional regulator [Betaproteobacteria bacterium]|nr:helix-turn-helix transcriptional regulator [Betaproteobacteria bacterium]